jgi:hypothetical protein
MVVPARGQEVAMTIVRFWRTAAGAGVALSGLTVWVVAAVSAMSGGGSSLWVIFGAVLAMTGMGIGFVALRPKPSADREHGEFRQYRLPPDPVVQRPSPAAEIRP